MELFVSGFSELLFYMTVASHIRPATPDDVPLLPAVELAAATLYLTQLEITG
jgi:hypothetical protein